MATHHRRSNTRIRVHGRRGALRLAVAREAAGPDHRLSALASEVTAGRRVECPWAALRIVHFPNVDDLEAAGELGEWARRNGVEVDFDQRKLRIGGIEHDVIYVLFAERGNTPTTEGL